MGCLADYFPEIRILVCLLGGEEGFEIEVSLIIIGVVATRAMLVDNWSNVFFVVQQACNGHLRDLFHKLRVSQLILCSVNRARKKRE